MATTIEPQPRASDDASGIAAQKRRALDYLAEAWNEAMADGVAPEVFAHAALFIAFADLVSTYGEEAVAELARSLPRRVEALEFTVDRAVQ
jgi:hypothetical protein